MWNIVSNIFSIITWILFILYIVWRIWKITVTINIKYEKFVKAESDPNFNINANNNVAFIDDEGDEFSISSTYEIRSVKIYKLIYNSNGDDSVS